VLSRDKYCTLIILCPKWSLAQYFDSSSTTTRKDYTRIRGVLDEAINGYAQNGGTFDKKGECIRGNGKHGFKHVTEFPCIKQPVGSAKEAFYAIHHLKGFVREAEIMNQPARIREWSNKLAGEIDEADLREDFHRIQVKLSEIILEDVNKGGGSLHYPRGLCQRDIQDRLHRQDDGRTWTTKDMYKPFPAPLPPPKKRSR
jgi:hypothetical protein